MWAEEERPVYPPETSRWMSWSTLKFIHRPSWRPLAWTCYGILGMIVLGVASSFFLRQDMAVEASGEIVPDPGALQVLAGVNGLMGTPRVSPGSDVKKGELLAVLQMELDERQITSILDALDRNIVLLERADWRTGIPTQVMTGQTFAATTDDAVREAAASLQAALPLGRTISTDPGQFEAQRNRAIESSHRLRSAIIGYQERHRLRAPGAGTVLQYEVNPSANVQAGQVVATLLPRDARLVARLRLEPRDVPNVAVGQSVLHNLGAYPYQRYGLFEGEVISIEQAPQTGGRLVYEIRTTIRNPSTLSPQLGAGIRLVTGMEMTSQITTGTRTLYELVADSFFRQP